MRRAVCAIHMRFPSGQMNLRPLASICKLPNSGQTVSRASSDRSPAGEFIHRRKSSWGRLLSSGATSITILSQAQPLLPRLSLSPTTTGAPPTWSASGDTLPSHLFQAFPSSHVWTQSHGRGCLSQSLSLLAASRRGWFGLATLSPNRRQDHKTVDPVAVGQHIRIADRYPRPAGKVVSAVVTFQPSDAFQ